MKPKLVLLIMVLLVGFSLAAPLNPSYPRAHNPLLADRVDISTGSGGDVDELTGSINGVLQAIVFMKGNFTGAGTVYVNSTFPYVIPLKSYNLSLGNSTYLNSTFPISGPLSVHMLNQQANKNATVYIFYR